MTDRMAARRRTAAATSSGRVARAAVAPLR
jgi:hypothetical protein